MHAPCLFLLSNVGLKDKSVHSFVQAVPQKPPVIEWHVQGGPDTSFSRSKYLVQEVVNSNFFRAKNFKSIFSNFQLFSCSKRGLNYNLIEERDLRSKV